ncbi:MAG: TIGR04053 family radical SAM/SPASM domain-containing protein [Planctomycetales bacterium]|nr:TIGR04053 family radical SAM/SPASM domain-containing protein [Planctomycetales bacterium]
MLKLPDEKRPSPASKLNGSNGKAHESVTNSRSKMWVRTRRSFTLSPMLVFYEMTQACDLVCQHCRACAQRKPAPEELGTAEAKLLVDQLTEFPEPPLLVLTGGDPLKRADIFELIEYALTRGLQVSITPSATPLVTTSAIKRLRDAGIARMAISIDGIDATTHDSVRGVAGSFQRSIEILEDARQLGLETQINTVLTPNNLLQIDAMADLFAEFEIALWSVFFLVPVGRGDHLVRLTAQQCEQAFERLWHQSLSQPYMIKTTEAPHYRRYVIQHQLERRGEGEDGKPHPFVPGGVNDGKGVMFVSHAGLVYPSGFLPIVCGSFPLQHLVKVYQESPVFRSLRDSSRLEGKCGRCEFRNICGGSRARAYAVTGNAFAQEPDCCYEPTE